MMGVRVNRIARMIMTIVQMSEVKEKAFSKIRENKSIR